METIGVITNDETGVFQQAIIKGAWVTADTEPCAIEVFSGSRAAPAPNAADGWLVIANAATPEWLARTQEAGRPITLVSHALPGLPAVVFDNRQGMLELVKHVAVQCGRRKLVLVRGAAGQYDTEQRATAFTDALMRYSVSAAGTINGEFAPDKATAALEAFLAEGHDFDAVVASDYMMALAVIDTLKRKKRRVPQDVSVVGFGDGPEARRGKLTTVAADVEELGRRAAKQLVHQMNGAKVKGVTTLSVKLIERNTSYDDPPDVELRKEKTPKFTKKR